MTEDNPAPKRSEPSKGTSGEAPSEASTPRLDTIDTEADDARLQLMRQWPSWDWEKR